MISAAHVSRTFKSLVGQTPTGHINQRRLDQASMLLNKTKAEIVDIALDCGFENLSCFYRRFKNALLADHDIANSRRGTALHP
jgi:AraC family transcriptional regulator, dual regulator of chb operon